MRNGGINTAAKRSVGPPTRESARWGRDTFPMQLTALSTDGEVVLGVSALKPVDWISVLFRSGLHVGLGLLLSAVILCYPRSLALWALAATTVSAWVIELTRLKVRAVGQQVVRVLGPLLRERELHGPMGVSYFLFGSLMSLVFFGQAIAVYSVVLLAVGDPVAGVVGMLGEAGNQPGKTPARCLVGLFGCSVAALVLRVVVPSESALMIAAGTGAASLAESLSGTMDDNLSIPILSGLVMSLLRSVA